MAQVVLQILISLGVALIMYGLAVYQVISPSTAIACGLIIILTSVWIGIRERRYKRTATVSALRLARLRVCNETKDFLHFCSIYWTKHCQGMVSGTNDLVARIHGFEKSLDVEGPLSMPDIEKRIKEISTNAWKLQRRIDCLGKGRHRPKNSINISVEDEIYDLIEWFAQQKKEIDELFEPYLIVTT